jgi:hypothetical protein
MFESNLAISRTFIHSFFLSSSFRSYAIPLTVALGSFILRFLADHTCSPYSDVCKKSSEFFSHVYAVVICFMLIVGLTKAQQVKELIQRIKNVAQVLNDDAPKSKRE